MRCESVRLQLSDIAVDEHACDELAFSAHIRECVDCQGRLERERAVVMLLREWSEPEFGDDERDRLRSGVREAIVAEALASKRSRPLLRLALAASVALAAIGLGIAGLDRVGGPAGGEAMAGPATKNEDAEPGVFTMVGPFSEKEKVEPRKQGYKPRRPEQKPRRVARRVPESHSTLVDPVFESGATDSDSMMRFEFQTQDPKIRIIWFVPRAEEDASTPTDIGD